jgi:hypothetical protein
MFSRKTIANDRTSTDSTSLSVVKLTALFRKQRLRLATQKNDLYGVVWVGFASPTRLDSSGNTGFADYASTVK